MKTLVSSALSWSFVVFLSLTLTSCLFLEGSLVDEPKDVVVTDPKPSVAFWENFDAIDVTEPSR